MRCNRVSVMVGAIVLTLVSNVAVAGEKLNDATILAIFDQANSTDIYVGRLGAKYGHSEEVRGLGKMVATDHVAVQQMGRDLANKLNIIPTPPDDDTSIAEHAKSVALLRSKSGSEFDKAYLKHEIVFHQTVINAVKGTLLPAVKNGELRNLLNKVLPGFEHHLAATKTVAEKLGVE